jgi:hypothetical protein
MTEQGSEVGSHTNTKNERKREDMKYIGYWELDLKDWEEAYRINGELGQAIRDNPDDFPEFVLGAHSIGGSNKGLTIFETDDPKKLLNISVPFVPVLKWKFLPLYPVGESNQIYQSLKKK